VFTFGAFRLDPADRRLRRDGVPLDLPPKAFDALALLVERAGRLVSKDDFHATLWPRTVVSEANLNKYVWQLRRTLGDGDWIETVPKLGYRFVAAVTIEDATRELPGPPVAPMPAVDAHARASARRVLVGTMAIALAIALVAVAWLRHTQPATTASIAATGTSPLPVARRTLAFAATVPAGGTSHALASSLPALLAEEMALSEDLRVLPRADVGLQFPDLLRPARADDRATGERDYARWRALGADLVASTTVASEPALGADGLRVDVRVYDIARAELVERIGVAGSGDHLDALVGQAGDRLRNALGLNPLSAALARVRRATSPADADAARAYGEALELESERMANGARERLAFVVARNPDFVPGWIEYARSLYDGGFAAQATAAARDGLVHAAAAPRELRLALEAVQYEASGAWPQAIASYDALYRFYPDRVDYALRLAGAQLWGGKPDDADALLASLRRQPGLADDARVLLQDAEIAKQRGDFARVRATATRLLGRADELGAPHLRARALLIRGTAANQLKDHDAAQVDLAAARAAFVAADDALFVARSDVRLALLAQSRNDLDAAGQRLRAALPVFERLGAQWDENIAIGNLVNVDLQRGDNREARELTERSLALSRTMGDHAGENWALAQLAGFAFAAGQTRAALAAADEAIAGCRAAGDTRNLAWTLADRAQYLDLAGRTEDAVASADEALRQAQAIDDATAQSIALRTRGTAELHGGHADAARRDLEQALALARRSDEPLYAALATLALADASLETGDAQAARDGLAPAIAELERSGARGALAQARALQARASAALGEHAAAREQLAASERGAAGADYVDALAARYAAVQLAAAAGDGTRARALAATLRGELEARELAGAARRVDALLAARR